MFKHLLTVLCLGLAAFGCTPSNPKPQVTVDLETAKKPEAPANFAPIMHALQEGKRAKWDGTWHFRLLEFVKGSYDAVAFNKSLKLEEKRYVGWFQCGTYTPKNKAGDRGTTQPFLAYFDPETGVFLTIIREEQKATADGCNRLYGRQALIAEPVQQDAGQKDAAQK